MMLTNSNLNDKPLISFCIPTFNRADKVFKLITDILKYKGNDIEVVVSDNCSTDATSDLLSDIKDPRFHFFQNEENIGGPFNQLKSLTLGNAKFAFFCLDKDYVDHKSIPQLIMHISDNADVMFGHCSLNLKTTSENEVYEKGMSSVYNMAYLSQHPSGIFYSAGEYKNLPLLATIFKGKKKFPFFPDLLNAQMAMLGKSLKMNFPAFYSESKEDSSRVISLTYDISDVFFSPTQRFVELTTYLNNAEKLGLSQADLVKLTKKLFGTILIASTIGYRSILNDHLICIHYGVQPRKVNLLEIIKISISFSLAFLQKKTPLSYYKKIFIAVYSYMIFVIRLIVSSSNQIKNGFS